MNLMNKYVVEYFSIKYTKNEFDNIIKGAKSNNKIYNVSLSDSTRIQRENCFKKCNYEDCVKLYMKRKNYKKCLDCQMDSKKCYKKLLTFGGCDTCSNYVGKSKCGSMKNYGCPRLNDIYSDNGIEPYFIEVPSKNNNSPFDSKCVFCWNIKSYI